MIEDHNVGSGGSVHMVVIMMVGRVSDHIVEVDAGQGIRAHG